MSDLYIATYSQVDVFESTFKNIPLMRRCDDNWVNATQILKIAGYGKAQRTRLLEKEVHKFEHRKIQGGFGRFQGTWVPLDFARRLAETHHLGKDKVRVLYYDPAIDGPIAKKQSTKPSDKKKKKRLSSSESTADGKVRKPKKRGRKSKQELLLQQQQQQQLQQQQQQQLQQQERSEVEETSRTPSNMPPTFAMFGNSPAEQEIPVHQRIAMHQMEVLRGSVHKTRPQQPVPSQSYQQFGYSTSTQQQLQQQPQSQAPHQQLYQAPPTFSSQNQPVAPQFSQYTQGQQLLLLQQQQQQQQLLQPGQQPNGYIANYIADGSQEEPQNVYVRSSSGTSASSEGMTLKGQGSLPYQQQQQQQGYFMAPQQQPQQQLPTPQSQPQLLHPMEMDAEIDQEDEYDYYTERMLNFFSNDGEPVPDFLFDPPEDFDINQPIDNEGHTPLHWASALALPSIVELLISKNANPLILNSSGMNSLSKLVHFTNSFDTKNFQGILNLLRQCLIVPDARGRTPLHYLIELSADPSKHDCLMYYLTEIATFIQDQQREAEKMTNNEGPHKDLLKILVNHRDNEGNTALHLALEGNSPDFVKALLRYGADADAFGLPKEFESEDVDETVASGHTPDIKVTDNSPYSTRTESTITKDQSLLLDQTPQESSLRHQNSTVTEAFDASENKENIFGDSAISKDLRLVSNNATLSPRVIVPSQLENSESVIKRNGTVATSTPSKSPDTQVDTLEYRNNDTSGNLDVMQNGLPGLLSKLSESISEEMSSRNEEVMHNLSTIGNLDREIAMLDKRCSKLIKGTFDNIEEAKFNALLNTSENTDRATLFNLLNAKIASYKEGVVAKRGLLYNGFERSQALEVAKVVNEEETKISEYTDTTADDKNESLKLAVQLTLLQIERRSLVNNKVESIIGGTGALLLDDPRDLKGKQQYNSDGTGALPSSTFNDERKMQAKMYLYRKLISNICDLPIEEIDKDLLDGIELRLRENYTAA
ncbi:DEKNAAC102556 [Brettanomyces naardenensis]|uniref:DEKNAAC102557 n=1 Tax=Brettanomyces naardenensis TaxID=13370 RepID=A0A448YKM6_BRENA|nr:DEKNAAC102556 [Brettanomyces naardenensis]